MGRSAMTFVAERVNTFNKKKKKKQMSRRQVSQYIFFTIQIVT